jgi:hypothetical protein
VYAIKKAAERSDDDSDDDDDKTVATCNISRHSRRYSHLHENCTVVGDDKCLIEPQCDETKHHDETTTHTTNLQLTKHHHP